MDPLLILMFGLLAVMIFFTWRNGKKRKLEAEQMQAKLVPGVEVMTQQGIFGTLLSVDDDSNIALIESTPGTVIRVHRQTLARVIEDEIVEDDDLAEETDVDEATEPEFGERSDDTKPRGQKPSETNE